MQAIHITLTLEAYYAAGGGPETYKQVGVALILWGARNTLLYHWNTKENVDVDFSPTLPSPHLTSGTVTLPQSYKPMENRSTSSANNNIYIIIAKQYKGCPRPDSECRETESLVRKSLCCRVKAGPNPFDVHVILQHLVFVYCHSQVCESLPCCFVPSNPHYPDFLPAFVHLLYVVELSKGCLGCIKWLVPAHEWGNNYLKRKTVLKMNNCSYERSSAKNQEWSLLPQNDPVGLLPPAAQ